MFYANNENGIRIEPTPSAGGICPTCGERVISKCGTIVSWHWSHLAGKDCDPWSEGETEWHLSWKRLVLPGRCEVRMPGFNGKDHRADIVGNGDTVVELQHSPISVEEIQEREWFYENMVWLFDATPFREKISIRRKDGFVTFRWKHPKKTLWFVRKPLYLDLGGNRVLLIKKLHQKTPCGGWGFVMDREDFIREFLSDHLKYELAVEK